MAELKLRNCPFCGGEAKYDEFTRHGVTYGYVYCIECKIGTPRLGILTHIGRLDAAAKRWNRRADNG